MTSNEIDAVCLVSPHGGPYVFYKCHASRYLEDGFHAVDECAYGLFFLVCQTVVVSWSAAMHAEAEPSSETHQQGGREARNQLLGFVSQTRPDAGIGVGASSPIKPQYLKAKPLFSGSKGKLLRGPSG